MWTKTQRDVYSHTLLFLAPLYRTPHWSYLFQPFHSLLYYNPIHSTVFLIDLHHFTLPYSLATYISSLYRIPYRPTNVHSTVCLPSLRHKLPTVYLIDLPQFIIPCIYSITDINTYRLFYAYKIPLQYFTSTYRFLYAPTYPLPYFTSTYRFLYAPTYPLPYFTSTYRFLYAPNIPPSVLYNHLPKLYRLYKL